MLVSFPFQGKNKKSDTLLWVLGIFFLFTEGTFGLKLETQIVVAGYNVDSLDSRNIVLPGDRILKVRLFLQNPAV